MLSNIAQSKVQHSPPHVPNRKQIFPSMSYNEQWLTPVRGMLTPSQPANRLPSAASGTAYPAIWTGASHVQCLCSSGTDTDPDPPATLPRVPTPHDAGPHRIKLQRSGSAHFRMLRLRPRLRTTCRRSCDLGQIGQDLEAVPARGCEPGPPSTDIMTRQHIRSPSSSDPRDVRSEQSPKGGGARTPWDRSFSRSQMQTEELLPLIRIDPERWHVMGKTAQTPII